ncbi:hypothetical protein AZE42_12664, partial [Rhizopogon vesiculosus]
MLMHFHGGGVGHQSTRHAADWFLADCDKLDKRSNVSNNDNSNDDDDQDDQDDQDEEELNISKLLFLAP